MYSERTVLSEESTYYSSSLGVLSSNVFGFYKKKKEVHNRDVIFDSELSLDVRLTKVVQSCFTHLRYLTKIRSVLLSAHLEKVIHALVSSTLEYCSVITTSKLLWKLC